MKIYHTVVFENVRVAFPLMILVHEPQKRNRV